MADMPPLQATRKQVDRWRAALVHHRRCDGGQMRRCIHEAPHCQRLKPWPCPEYTYARMSLIACGAGIEEET